MEAGEGRNHPAWRAFVPPTMAVHGVGRGDPIAEVTFDDTVTLFLDVAGFTPLTAALEEHGAVGLEQLQELLNSFFGRVDRTIEAWGGSVVRYEGDAVVAMFSRASRLDDALGAAVTVLDIADDLAAVETLAGMQGIRAKIGLAIGPLRSLLFDQGSHRGVVVAGDALDAAVDAEHRATPGQIIAAPDVAAGLRTAGHDLRPAAPGDAFHRIIPGRDRLSRQTPTPPSFEWSAVDPGLLLDRIVLERVNRGLAATDFRAAGTLFVGLDGIGDLTELVPAAATMSRIVTEAGGALLSLASGDKGHKALITVGAPTAIDDIEGRTLAIADALLSEPSLRVRIGATTAVNLAGRLGGSVRADYTVLGNGVNMAARLMGLAEPGAALVDEATATAVADRFRFSDPMDLDVKGRATPLRVRSYTAGGTEPPTTLTSTRSRFVGRDAELDSLATWWAAAANGDGRVGEVVGEAGIGKTRLVQEFIATATIPNFLLNLPRHRRTIGVNRLAPLFRWLVGLPDDEVPTDAAVDRILELTGWDAGREPYLRVLLDAIAPDGDDESGSGAGSPNAAELLRSMAVDLVRRRADEGPILIAVDGAEGLRGLSSLVFDDIARGAPTLPLLLLVIGREQSDLPDAARLVLTQLSAEHAGLLAASLGEADPAALAAKVGGNPLAVELAVGSDADDLRLTALVGSRIESAGETAATWLREAAVFGEYLPLRPVTEAVGAAPPAVFSAGLVRADLSGEWARFDSDLMREVAYDSLTGARRRTLHHAAGSTLERRLDLDDAVTPAMVADHFSHTDDADRQRIAFRRAGTAAANAFDLEDAVVWYELLAPLVDGPERGDVALQLGDWLTTLGDWDRAEGWFDESLSLAEVAPARALAGIAGIRQVQGRNDDAVELLNRAQHEARRADDHPGLARVLTRLADVTWGNRSPEEIELVIAEMRELAPAVGGDLEVRAEHAEATLALALRQQPDRARELLHRAIERAAGDRVLLSELHNDLAGTYYVQNRHTEALDALAVSRQHAHAIGYRRAEAAVLANEAAVLVRLGAARRSLRMCRDAATLQLSMGEGRFAVLDLNLAATVYAALGHDDVAHELFVRLEQLVAGQVGGIAELAVRHHFGRSLFRRGEHELALEQLRKVDALSEQIGYRDFDEDQGALEVRITAATEPSQVDEVFARRFDEPTAVSAYEAWRLDPRRVDEARVLLTEAFAATPTARLARRLRAVDPPGPADPIEENATELIDPDVFFDLIARLESSVEVVSPIVGT